MRRDTFKEHQVRDLYDPITLRTPFADLQDKNVQLALRRDRVEQVDVGHEQLYAYIYVYK